MGFSDKFKAAVKGVEAAEPVAEETKQFDVMAFLKQKLAEKGAEPVADETLNPDLVAEGPDFLEKAKTAIGTMGKSVDDLVERTPALKATRDFVSDGWNKLVEKFTPEAAASGAVAGASVGGLKQLFNQAEGHGDTMDIRPDMELPKDKWPDWLKPDGKKPGIQLPDGPDAIGPLVPDEPGADGIDKDALDEVVSGLTEEEKAMMTEFQLSMANKMLDVIEMGANYGISGENVSASMESMCENYMSQMTPEQMTVMIGVLQKCGAAGLIDKNSSMEDVSRTFAMVMVSATDIEAMKEGLSGRIEKVTELARAKGLDLNVEGWLEDVGISMAPVVQPEPEFEEPPHDGFELMPGIGVKPENLDLLHHGTGCKSGTTDKVKAAMATFGDVADGASAQEAELQ